jgi:hypothetical protein
LASISARFKYLLEASLAGDLGRALAISLDMREAKSMIATGASNS